MTALQHVYVTAHGLFTDSAWSGETAQIGVRLAIAAEGAEPAKGSIFTIDATNGDVVADSGTQAGTHGTLTRTWTARLGDTGSLENADAAWQIDLAEDFWTFLTAIKNDIAAGFRFTHVKIAPILADGKYGAPAAMYQFTTAVVGNAGAEYPLPPEVAVAVSFRAPVLGRRGRGRFYIPGLRIGAVDASGSVSAGVRTALSNAAATLVTNLENAPGTEIMTPVLMVTSAGSASAVRPSMIRVGSHFDVQRRRQHQVPETYTQVTL